MQATSRQGDTRGRIVEAALRLFCEKGYAAVGTQEICEAADVLKGSLYHYFPSKLEVALAALKAYGESVRAQFEAAARSAGTAEEKLARLFENVRRQARADRKGYGVMHGCLHGNFALELSAKEPRVREALEEISEGWGEALRPIFAELGPAGDPRRSAQAFLAYLHGVVLMAKTANDPDLIPELGRRAPALIAPPEAAAR